MSMFFEPLESHRQYFKKHGQLVNMKKGQYYVMADNPSPWVFFLEDGFVQISFTFSDGGERILGYFLPGMTFAQTGSFFEEETGGLEYKSIGNSTAYRLPRKEFLEQLAKDPAFAGDYTTALLRNQIYLTERIVYQGENRVYARTIRWLLLMAKYYSTPDGKSRTIYIPLTQETAANFMHITRESASAAFRKLTKLGHIRVSKKLITISNIDKLKAELN